MDLGSILFERKETHDVTFEVGPQRKTISAHKVVLKITSDVFNAMFTGPWIENGKENPMEPNMESDDFAEFIKFLYKSECNITAQNADSLMYAATKYQIPKLVEKCEKFLCENLDYDESNALMCYMTSQIYECDKLEKAALHLISKNIESMMKTDEFLELSVADLNGILSRDNFAVAERHVFDALMSWGKAECLRKSLEPTGDNIRKCVEPSLTIVRFPLMTPIEIHLLVPNILTAEELCSIYEYNCLKDNSKWIQKQTYFSSSHRNSCDYKVVFYKERGTSCGASYNRYSYLDKRYRNQFKVNKPILLNSLGFYSSPCQDDVFNVKVNIYERDSAANVYSGESLKSAEKNTTFYMRLTKPLKIKADTWYSINFVLQGPATFYGAPQPSDQVHRVTCGSFGDVQFLYNSYRHNLPELVFKVDEKEVTS